VSVTKTEVYTILRDVCIVSNRKTCIDFKLSEMEILAQPLSLPFIIENLIPLPPVAPPIGDTSLTYVMKLAAHSTASPTPTAMRQ
jgi:hypothetical protein